MLQFCYLNSLKLTGALFANLRFVKEAVADSSIPAGGVAKVE